MSYSTCISALGSKSTHGSGGVSRCTVRSPYLSCTGLCLLFTSPSNESTTTVPLCAAISPSLRCPMFCRPRITPSSCHGVVEHPGYQCCHDMLIFSSVSTSVDNTCSAPASRIARSTSASTVSGVVATTDTTGDPTLRLPADSGSVPNCSAVVINLPRQSDQRCQRRGE